MGTILSRTSIARQTGISRSALYYEHKQFKKDWELKIKIEETLNQYPSYGHRRIAQRLRINKKRVLRVMQIFGIKPYRRRGRKFQKAKKTDKYIYPNLLLITIPSYQHHVWASDFTHITYKGKVVYIATVLDIFTRQIVGFSVLTSHSVQLVMTALTMAITQHGKSEIIHSDQGSEYTSKDYTSMVGQLNIKISMSRRASPWENGYQESFYNQFKVDLGDPNRFETLGELVAVICEMMHIYNTDRIHSALKMPPREYAIMKSLNQATPVH